MPTLSDEESYAEAARRWLGRWREPHVRRDENGTCRVGYDDGEFFFCMGSGNSWEEAFQDADSRRGSYP